MEIPKDTEPFTPNLKWTQPKDEIYVLFDNAALALMNKPWVEICDAWGAAWIANIWIGCEELLPYPDKSKRKDLPSGLYRDRRGADAIHRLDKIIWGDLVSKWIRTEMDEINKKRNKVRELIDEAIPIINNLYKKHLKHKSVYESWLDTVINLSLSDYKKLEINTKTLSGLLADRANEYKNRRTDGIVLPPVTGDEIESAILEARHAKQKVVPFNELLVNFRIDELERMLIDLKYKNEQGDTILPNGKKSSLHGLLDALSKFKLIKEVPRIKSFNSLCRYMGFKRTDIKAGFSEAEQKAKIKAMAYLKKLDLKSK